MSERRVLLTGAAGFVGGILRSHWADRYSLRLSDIRDITDPEGHEIVKTDITDFGQFLAACDGVDVVVHLAADPSRQAEFYDSLLPLNIIGSYNAFQAAHKAGCERIVFASSVNAVLGHGGGEPVSWDVPVHPLNV